MVLLEVCVDSVAGVLAARDGGAARVELCAGLIEGGTTPSAGLLELALEQVDIDIRVLVRPRGGDFLYDASEWEVLRRDVRDVAQRGAGGVVIGALTADGELDPRFSDLLEDAGGLPVTFHRAFDMARDTDALLEQLIGLGVEAVLSSGAAGSALAGSECLKRWVTAAGERISVMPGGGIRAHNVGQVVAATGASAVHCSAFDLAASEMRHRNAAVSMASGTPPGEYERRFTSADLVRGVVQALS